MDRINTVDGLFHEGNPATGEKGTKVTADWLNALQETVINLSERWVVAHTYPTLAAADAAAVAAGKPLLVATLFTDVPTGLAADVTIIPGGDAETQWAGCYFRFIYRRPAPGV